MRYTIRTVGPVSPATEIPLALSLADAKAHLKVDFDDDDDLISGYIASSQDAVERFTSQVLAQRVMELATAGFPWACGAAGSDAIALPRDPVTAIVSLSYTDGNGADIDLGDADWRWTESAPTLVRPAWATSWPAAAAEDGSVRVRFEAGYEDGLCPASLVEAVKRQTAWLYGNRGDVGTAGAEDGLGPGVAALCRSYRRIAL